MKVAPLGRCKAGRTGWTREAVELVDSECFGESAAIGSPNPLMGAA